METKKTVAVIGAGITGSTAALMLADLGYRVCVFDGAPLPMRGASWVNEGKIHLGFVYVNDPTSKSIDVMVESAVVFRAILERWIPSRVFESAITNPFEYLVPTDTQIAPEHIDQRFATIAEKIQAAETRYQSRYLGVEHPEIWTRCSEVEDVYSSSEIIAQYRTMERSVDTHLIAESLTRTLEAHEAIELCMNTHIDRIEETVTQWSIQGTRQGQSQTYAPFDFVINASWDGRLQLDEQVFGPETGTWYHRFKHAINLKPESQHLVRNFTAIIGTYGDIIQYPSGRVYLSYYPAGMLSSSDTIQGVQTLYSEATRDTIARETVQGLSQYMPAVDSIFSPCNPRAEHVAGGIIMARGKTDIDDRESELHQRHRIGIRQHNGFLSIDTGKYTCGPALAEAAVKRICG